MAEHGEGSKASKGCYRHLESSSAVTHDESHEHRSVPVRKQGDTCETDKLSVPPPITTKLLGIMTKLTHPAFLLHTANNLLNSGL
jgi:hypothetical protein